MKDKKENRQQDESKNKKIAGKSPTQAEQNLENANNSEQNKVENSKAEENKESSSEEEKTDKVSFEIPRYAYNQATHNLPGLVECIKQQKVTDSVE